jgi:hypothetical protein
VRPPGLHLFRHAEQELAALHRAGPGHHRQPLAADPDTIDGHHGVLRVEITAGQLVGLHDGENLLHHGEGLDGLVEQDALVPDGADDRPFHPSRQVGREAEGLDASADLADLFLGGSRSQHDDHGITLSRIPIATSDSEIRRLSPSLSSSPFPLGTRRSAPV